MAVSGADRCWSDMDMVARPYWMKEGWLDVGAIACVENRGIRFAEAKRPQLCSLLAIFLAGCASCPGDNLRIVNPVTWGELDLPKLQDRCNDWSPNLRGCVVSGPTGDMIFVLPLEKHVGTEL